MGGNTLNAAFLSTGFRRPAAVYQSESAGAQNGEDPSRGLRHDGEEDALRNGIDIAIGTDDGRRVGLTSGSGQLDACVVPGGQVPALEVAVLIIGIDGFARNVDDGGIDAPLVVVSKRTGQRHHFLHVGLAGEWIGLRDIRIENRDLI